MSMTITIEALKLAGLTAEQIVAVLEAAEALATRPSTGAERTAKWRANRTECGDNMDASQRDDVTSPSPNVTPPISLSIDSKIKKERKIQRGTRMTPDWEPGEAERAYAQDQGMPPDLIDRIAASFRDYWLGVSGANGVKLDWAATWRNRVRFICDKMGLATGPPRTVVSAAEFARLRERYMQKQREQM